MRWLSAKLNLMNTVLLESYGRFLHTADVLGVCKRQFDVHSISTIIYVVSPGFEEELNSDTEHSMPPARRQGGFNSD